MSRRNLVVMALALLLVFAGKAYTISAYAPLRLGDLGAYSEAADEILAGTDWLTDARLEELETPPTLYRPIGYSMMIAGARLVAGDDWKMALATFQGAISLLSGLVVLRLALAAGLSLPWAAAVFVLHQWSIPLSTDALFMEDAVIGALGTTALCLLLLPMVRGQVPGTLRFAVSGALVGAMFLFREVFHFIMPFAALTAFVALYRLGLRKRAVLAAVLLLAPVLMVSSGLKAWNEARTGTAVTNTGGQTAYVYALVMAMRYDKSIADGDTPLAIAMRETNKTFDYEDSRAANVMMFTRFGMNSIEQHKAAEKLFWHTLATNPVPLVRGALGRLRVVQQGTLFAGPLTRIDDLDWWAARFGTGWRASKDRFLETWDIATLTPEAAINIALRAVTRIVGMAGLLLFLIGAPVAWLKLRHQWDGLAHTMVVVWGLYLLFVAMYIPVSFEVRYMGVLIGPALLFTVILARRIGELRDAVTPAPTHPG